MHSSSLSSSGTTTSPDRLLQEASSVRPQSAGRTSRPPAATGNRKNPGAWPCHFRGCGQAFTTGEGRRRHVATHIEQTAETVFHTGGAKPVRQRCQWLGISTPEHRAPVRPGLGTPPRPRRTRADKRLLPLYKPSGARPCLCPWPRCSASFISSTRLRDHLASHNRQARILSARAPRWGASSHSAASPAGAPGVQTWPAEPIHHRIVPFPLEDPGLPVWVYAQESSPNDPEQGSEAFLSP